MPYEERRVHWANDEVTAGIVASFLRSEGIPARIRREDPSIFLWGRAAAGGFAVVVPDAFEDEARRALASEQHAAPAHRERHVTRAVAQFLAIALGLAVAFTAAAWWSLQFTRR